MHRINEHAKQNQDVLRHFIQFHPDIIIGPKRELTDRQMMCERRERERERPLEIHIELFLYFFIFDEI